jgi:outer membrane lipoprotein-sorting protein
MNSDDHEAKQNDLLGQAIGAVKREASVSQLPQRTVADTLAALRKAEAKHSPRIWNRVIAMTFTQKIAAAIGLTIGGLTLYFVLSLFSGFSSVTYAQVAAQIRAVKSMSYKIHASVPGSDKTVSMDTMWEEPGRFRMQMSPDMAVITDMTSGHSLVLNNKEKTATVIDLGTTALPSRRPADENYIEYFKKLADGKGDPAGEETINGIKTKKFRVQIAGWDAIVFADAKTGAPIKVEYENVVGASHLTMDDFNFDANLDPALFSVDPPADYKIEKETLHVNRDLAENVVPVLKFYAQRSDGHFPKDLNNWADFIKKLFPAGSTTAPVDTQGIMSNVGAITALLSEYQKGKTYDYLPDNGKLGDADKIIFWYQPKDSKTFKAIYGDLHVGEVAADKLPTPPSR